MPIDRPGPRSRLNRRKFLARAGWTGLGAAALVAGPGRRRALAQAGTRTRLDPGQHQAAQARRDPDPRLRLGPARASIPRLTQSVGLFQFAGLVGSRLVRYVFPDEATGPADLTPQGRPRGVVDSQPRPARVDLQAAPGRQVAQRAAAQRARAGGRGRQVLLRGVREGRRAVVHVPGDRGHRDAGQVHGARPPQDAQRAVPAEPGGADHGDLRPRGPGGGRRPQEAHDRHRALHPEGAHPQGPGGARAESRLLRQGPPVRRRVRHPLHAGRGDPHGRVPHGAERHSSGWRARREAETRPQDEPERRRCSSTTTRWRRSGWRWPRTSRPSTTCACGARSRWPSTGRSRWTRCSRGTASSAGACPTSTTRTSRRRRPSSGPGGSTARRRRRSSWPRPGTRTASRPRCSTTSTSRR